VRDLGTHVQPPDRHATARLVLRRWRPADAALMKAAIDASLAHLQAWMPWANAERFRHARTLGADGSTPAGGPRATMVWELVKTR
jgi:RimJ/RimL family protein N-acetyltransferase